MRKIFQFGLMAAAIWGCGGGGDTGEAGGAETTRSPESGAAGSDASSATSGGYARDSFTLCPALEPHRAELAAIVGFEQDAERELAVFRSECIVHGEDGAFARVSLAPAVMRSVAMQAGGYDGETSPVPELGPEARFVDQPLQPHVIFSMGPLILDVDAENIETPSRPTMIELATRVREILAEANG